MDETEILQLDQQTFSLIRGGSWSTNHYYDTHINYKQLYQASQSAMTRAYPQQSAPEDIRLLPVLSAETCARVSPLCRSNDNCWNEPKFMRPLFEEIFSPAIDAQLTSHFHSEYMILWHKAQSLGSDHAAYSFKWHCDSGPTQHLKLLIYLNGFEEHGGNTIFMDRATTDRFKDIGYVFCPKEYRTHDLAPLAAKYEIPYNEMQLEPKTGDAYLFEPTNLLHKGSPSRPDTWRDTLSVCLLPFPMSWRNSIEKVRFPPHGDNTWPNFSG